MQPQTTLLKISQSNQVNKVNLPIGTKVEIKSGPYTDPTTREQYYAVTDTETNENYRLYTSSLIHWKPISRIQQPAEQSNVVQLFKDRENKIDKQIDFESIVENNNNTKQRLERERLQANKNVLKAYKIK